MSYSVGWMARRKPQANRSQAGENRVILEPTKTGFLLRLGPAGVSQSGHGTFWVGLIFCFGVAILAACFLVFPHLGSTHKGVYTPPTHEPAPWQCWAGVGLFAAISVAITLFGLSMGVRKAVIEIDGDTLIIEEKGLLSPRRSQWERGQLKAIQTGPSGFSVGGTKRTGRSGAAGKSIQQLHIYLVNGQRVRFLTGRNHEDLDAIAEHLRNGLTLPTTEYDGG